MCAFSPCCYTVLLFVNKEIFLRDEMLKIHLFYVDRCRKLFINWFDFEEKTINRWGECPRIILKMIIRNTVLQREGRFSCLHAMTYRLLPSTKTVAQGWGMVDSTLHVLLQRMLKFNLPWE